MVSEKFRYQLREEAQEWQKEGLISSDIYDLLATRYQLDELDLVSRDLFVTIFLAAGFVLLGLGVITFVAANWQIWSRFVRVLLLLSLFTAANCAGFLLWRSPNSRSTRLGEGLLLLGALILGANLGLMSQMFHQTGASYTLYLIWGLGVWAMAFGLRLTSLGVMAIILMAIAYFLGIYRIAVWFDRDLNLVLQQMSLIIFCLFIPLAHYCRSRWIFGLSLVLTISSLIVNIGHYLSLADLSELSFLRPLLFVLIPAWLWSCRHNVLFPRAEINFDSIDRKLAILYLAFLGYLGSFNLWQENFDYYSPTGKLIDFTPWSWLIAPTIFTIISIWGWSHLGIRRTDNLSWRLDRNSTYVGIALSIVSGLIWLHQAFNPLGIGGTIIFNLLLFLLAIVLIEQSVKEGRRFNFWLGIVLLILQVLTRMFEYNTGLILKAIALFLFGIAAILAGLWFERHLSDRDLNSQG